MSELYHHGILGQKWGVRRYQNEDGTYTSVGRKRRESENSREISDENKKKAKNIAKATAKSAATHLAIDTLGGLAVVGASATIFVKTGKPAAGAAMMAAGALTLSSAKTISKVKTGKTVYKELKHE